MRAVTSDVKGSGEPVDDDDDVGSGPPVFQVTSLGGMQSTARWEQLFDDLDSQAQAAEAAEFAAEVSERTRMELASVRLTDRLAAALGQPITVHLLCDETRSGVLVDLATQWLLLGGSAPALLPITAVTGVSGMSALSCTTGPGVLRRLGLASALRAVARDRSPVRLTLVDATRLDGTVDAVGLDHLDLAEHPTDEPRRARTVRNVRVVPFSALAVAQPAAGTSSLDR